MVMEQVRKHKVWELPLHELQNVAPDIAWSNPPTISPDLSPVQVFEVSNLVSFKTTEEKVVGLPTESTFPVVCRQPKTIGVKKT